MTWRSEAEAVIARVRRENPSASPAEIRKLVRKDRVGHDFYIASHPRKAMQAALRAALGAGRVETSQPCGACAGRGWVALGASDGSVGCRACGGKGKARASAADERQTSMEVQS